VLFSLLVLTQTASLNSRDSETIEDMRLQEEDLREDNVVLAAEEEEARVYKGYNGGNRVWYG